MNNVDCRRCGSRFLEKGNMFLPVADRRAASFFSRRSTRGSLLCTLLFVCHAAAQTPQPDIEPGKVSGTVINAVTKAPIPRALVSSSDNRFALLTDNEGHFEFTMPNDSAAAAGTFMFEQHFRFGRCWLTARKPGFFYDCDQQGAGGRSAGEDQTIALVPEAIIHGRVTWTGSDALSGTDVQLFSREVIDGFPRWVPRNNSRTNSAGEFRFAELRAGEYKVSTQERADDDPVENAREIMYGYPPVFYPAAADFASAATIHLSAGQSLQADLSLLRQRYYRVIIPVSSADTLGTNVKVRSQSGPGYSLGYNRAMARIEGFLPNGNYIVEGTVFGPSLASGVVNLKVNGAPAEGPPMTLVPACSITLEVKEQFTNTKWNGQTSWGDGKRTFTLHGPRAYLQANVEAADDLQPMRGGALRPPTGPDDSSMVIENLTPGRYWLRLYPSRGYVASARMGNLDLLHQPFELTPGAAAPIEIEMRDDTAEINGTLTGIGSRPAGVGHQSPQAWVYCVPLPDSPGQFQQLPVNEDGHFSNPMIAPGGYRVLAFTSSQNRLPYRDAEAMKAYDTKGEVVHLSAGQKVNLQVAVISNSDSLEQ
jgi:hypothetical protein